MRCQLFRFNEAVLKEAVIEHQVEKNESWRSYGTSYPILVFLRRREQHSCPIPNTTPYALATEFGEICERDDYFIVEL
jgi:hypothetical protein